jgi:hypothetical protein
MVSHRRELAGVGVCWYQHLSTQFFSTKPEET